MSSESSTFNGKSPQVSVRQDIRLVKLELRQYTGTSQELVAGNRSSLMGLFIFLKKNWFLRS
ncbi:hypothetical protein LguiA_034700 [Lonicera macranthoides]